MASIESAASVNQAAFLREAFSEFSISVAVLVLRVFARTKTVGFRGWQGDDYFAVLCILLWIVEVVLVKLILNNGVNIGIPEEARYQLSLMPDLYARFVLGAKCYWSSWFVYISMIWSLKGCTLFLFNRITLGLWQQKVVKWTAVLVVMSYIAIILSFCLQCQPLKLNWQIYPNPGNKCTNNPLNYHLIGSTNVVTDAILLVVPFPTINRANIPLTKKIGLTVLLSSGIFIVIASLLRWIISVQDIENVSTGASWAIREGFVATIAVNLPSIYPLFSRFRRHNDPLIFNPPGNMGRSETTCIGMQRVGSHPDNQEDFKNFIFGLGKRRSNSVSSVCYEERNSDGIKITTTYEVT